MKNLSLFAIVIACAASASPADFPQWRGPDGNGVVDVSFQPTWDKAPKILWKSNEIPGDSDGGFASPVLADGRVYLFVNDKYGIPFEHRMLARREFQRLGGDFLSLPAEKIQLTESIRTSEPLTKLSGKDRNEYIEEQVAKAFPNEEDRKKMGNVMKQRLRRADNALDLAELKALSDIVDRKFDNQAALDQWFKDYRISDEMRKEALKRIPTEKPAAKDRIVCLDSDTGKQLWAKEYEGQHRGWATSSTPCVSGGKVYVGGSGGNLYCLNAENGKEMWVTDLGGAEINSSPVVIDSMVFIQANVLMAVDAGDGRKLYQIDEAKGRNGSPVLWKHEGKDYLLTNASGKLFCIDPAKRSVLWTAKGGGNASPAVAGDICAILTDKKETGLLAYKLTPERAEKLFASDAIRDRGASAVVHDGFVYAFSKSDAVCIQAASGNVAWKSRIRGSAFSSPVIADGKIVAVVGGGLDVYKASPMGGMTKLASARMPILRCTSPALAEGKLLLRTKTNVICYELPKAN